MSKSILVVDDSKFIYEEMKFFLEGTDFEITGYCQDGESALEYYEKYQPDVVTMDIVLPGIDGLEAAEIILKAHPDARIIVVSSLAYDDTIDRANEIGVMGFLFKPIEKGPLVEMLEKVLVDANA